jgi:ubiquitin carboxyl-terminal hydrolase 4/11/15
LTSAHKESSLTLENCLDLYCTEERLSESNMWHCSKCKEHKQATKKMDIWSTPELLIIHLKRFSNVQGMFREKISTMVDFPTVLDLAAHMYNYHFV